MTTLGRVETDGGRRPCRITGGGLSPASSRHWPPDADSGRPAEAVCFTPIRQICRMSPPSCRLLLFLSCYLALHVVPASK